MMKLKIKIAIFFDYELCSKIDAIELIYFILALLVPTLAFEYVIDFVILRAKNQNALIKLRLLIINIK